MLSLLKPRASNVAEAKGARDVARKALAEVQSRLERLHEVIETGDQAARAASDAARKAGEARAAWVIHGCPPNDRSHQALADRAAELALAAQSTAHDAAAVAKQMAQAEHLVQSAQSALRECEDRINAAIGDELTEEFWPTLERRRQLIDELQSIEVKTRGFLGFVPYFSAASSRRIADELASVRLKGIPDYEATPAGSIVSRPPDEVLALTARWHERARLLNAAL